MASTTSLQEFCQKFGSATGFLLDSHAKGEMGGSGETFAWNKIPAGLKKTYDSCRRADRRERC